MQDCGLNVKGLVRNDVPSRALTLEIAIFVHLGVGVNVVNLPKNVFGTDFARWTFKNESVEFDRVSKLNALAETSFVNGNQFNVPLSCIQNIDSFYTDMG